MSKTILLCVAGMTPQIITETLYALHISGECVDEIRVITTLEGRNRILSTLLQPETGRFHEFCRDFEIEAGSIQFDETMISLLSKPDGTTLGDIRTPEENEAAGNQICEIVRELCQREDVKIHASVAGGRKTMSIYLTLAMSLFGRAKDSLSHVLVNELFESNTNFYYPPRIPKLITAFNVRTKEEFEISTAAAEIYLAPIPFLRLRGIGQENEAFGRFGGYVEMVNETQKSLDIREQEYDLTLQLRRNTVFVRGHTVKLTPREFFFFLIFARRRAKGDEKLSLRDLTFEDFEEAFVAIRRAHGRDEGWEQRVKYRKFDFAESMLRELESGKSVDFNSFRQAFSEIVSRIRDKFKAAGIIDSRYYLISLEDGTSSYRLAIGAHRIVFS